MLRLVPQSELSPSGHSKASTAGRRRVSGISIERKSDILASESARQSGGCSEASVPAGDSHPASPSRNVETRQSEGRTEPLGNL